jgi:hypothetical protein
VRCKNAAHFPQAEREDVAERNVERDPTLERLEAFSSGVFAIGMTLLVFELVVPHLTGTVSGYAFPTSLLGEYALKPGAQTVAALIYGS